MSRDITTRRLHAQGLLAPRFKTPAETVAWFGAMQGQDYNAAKWAIGLRTKGGATDATIEAAIADGSIVRSWPLRCTLHFVAAQDLRWILALSAPRVLARAAPRFRELKLTDAIFARAHDALALALAGVHRTRSEVARLFEDAGIDPGEQRLSHILQHAQIHGLICYAPNRGKQQAFALIDEWVTAAPILSREDAVIELARRYFQSHGPATEHDFAWWSGLTIADARRGMSEVADTVTPRARKFVPTCHLLPAYDEYVVAYRDRSAISQRLAGAINERGGMLSPVIEIDGQIVGTWRRVVKGKRVQVELTFKARVTKAERERADAAVEAVSQIFP